MTDEFSVIVPYKAFSAATLTALGADEIVMHPMANLGPTDPTVTNSFNPIDPVTNQKVGISVEDVHAFIQFVKDDVGIQHQDELIQAFSILANNVHPLALGNVKRQLTQSRQLAKKILMLHMGGTADEHSIDELVESFASKLNYHGHPINRSEAKNDLGMSNIVFPNQRLEKSMWNLYLQYESELEIRTPFNPSNEFLNLFPALAPKDAKLTDPLTAKLTYIESSVQTDVKALEYQIHGEKLLNGALKWTMNVLREGWTQEG